MKKGKETKISTSERIAGIPRIYIAYTEEIFNRPRAGQELLAKAESFL